MLIRNSTFSNAIKASPGLPTSIDYRVWEVFEVDAGVKELLDRANSYMWGNSIISVQ